MSIPYKSTLLLGFLAGCLLISGPTPAVTSVGDQPADLTSLSHCKPKLTSKLIWAKRRERGKRRARINWRHRARIKYGLKYDDWNKAKNRGYSIGYNPGSNRPWRITAYGCPCK